jgi:choline kinase
LKAVILAAGQGTRLLPHTRLVPKNAVEVRGMPLIEHQLIALASRVDEVILVTGYLHDRLDALAAGRCVIVHNDVYATTNSLYSLWLAREHVEGQEFVLLNGDNIFDEDVLCQVLDAPSPTALLVDSEVALIEGEMNVVVRDGKVIEIGKELPLNRANAQSLQLVKFGALDSKLLFERADALIESGETGRFPTYAYPAIFEGSAMAAIQRRGGVWFEIDTLDDLARCEMALAVAHPSF